MVKTLGNQRDEVGCGACGVGCHVLPGQADHSPLGQCEEAVAFAVVIEAARGVVGGAAVEFDYELGVWPHRVWVDRAVGDCQWLVAERFRQVELLDQGLEAVFQLFSGDASCARCDQARERRSSPSARIALDQMRNPDDIPEPRNSASLNARSSWSDSVAARSRSVRATVVAGIP